MKNIFLKQKNTQIKKNHDLNYWKNDAQYKLFDIRSIALSGIIVGFLVAIKYLLGFISGVELVTFFVIIVSAFMRYRYLILIIPSFIMCVGAIYGMGPWWIMYWFIFSTESFLTRLFRKFLTLNNIIIALWAGFWGFSIMFWYAIYDFILFNVQTSIANMSSAIITNSIEGLTNFIAGLTLFYPLKNVFQIFIGD